MSEIDIFWTSTGLTCVMWAVECRRGIFLVVQGAHLLFDSRVDYYANGKVRENGRGDCSRASTNSVRFPPDDREMFNNHSFRDRSPVEQPRYDNIFGDYVADYPDYYGPLTKM
jgi:hypothetical protein